MGPIRDWIFGNNTELSIFQYHYLMLFLFTHLCLSALGITFFFFRNFSFVVSYQSHFLVLTKPNMKSFGLFHVIHCEISSIFLKLAREKLNERRASYQLTSTVLRMTRDWRQRSPHVQQAEKDGCEPVDWHFLILTVENTEEEETREPVCVTYF